MHLTKDREPITPFLRFDQQLELQVDFQKST